MILRRTLAMAVLTLVGWNMPAAAADMLVAAGSSLGGAFTELAVGFQQSHPGSKVLMSFASSDALADQVAQGAPIDVLATADPASMDRAAQSGRIDAATRRNFAGNEVVLIVPSANPLNIGSVDDLAGAGVKRVVFGNPANVPAGRYAKAALERSGQWDIVKRREVLAKDVRQALDIVARGEADAGFVFASDASVLSDKVRAVQTLASPSPVSYAIALVQRPDRHPQAQAFLDYVVSPQGAAVLAKYGFTQP
jgi:molybdate transport system substrate-binding protein